MCRWASGRAAGLDSSTILHYAAAETASRLKTFSVSFSGRSFDESRYFREVAAALRHRPPRVRPEPGRWTSPDAIEESRLLLGRAERGCRRAAGLVPVAHEPPPRHGGALRGRRRRVVRRLYHLPGGRAGAPAARGCPPRRGGQRRWALRATAGLRRQDQPRVQAEAGSGRLPAHPDEAHFFWNGAFSSSEKRGSSVRRTAMASAHFIKRSRRTVTPAASTATFRSTRLTTCPTTFSISATA